MSVLLTRRAVVQAAIEDTYGTPKTMTVNDGVLVSEPTYTIDPNVLERNYTRDSLSQTPHIIGRKLASMEFTTELRGNGKQHSGQLADAPIIARLFRACGYELKSQTNPWLKGVFEVGAHKSRVSWNGDVTLADNTDVICYFIEVVTGGGSGVAQVVINSDVEGESSGASAAVKATGSIEFSSQPDPSSTITLNGSTVTFVSSTPGSNEVEIGQDLAETLANLVDFLNGSADAEISKCTYSASGGDTLLIEYDTPGAAGNSFTLAVHADSNGTVSGATLSGGADATTGHTLTSGSPLNVGTHGLVLTPTFTGDLEEGQKWVLWLMPKGLALNPISDNFESLTLVMYKDGVKHVMPGAFGTFEITATAGDFATIQWTFTGLWQQPVDEPMPTPNYERTMPSQVELARLRVGGFHAVVEEFTFDQANDIQPRPDVSSDEGYIGIRIVSRAPEGGINPEADLVANNDFWNQLATAERMPFQMRVGYEQGNTVWMIAPGVQYTGLTYQDRDGILAYDAGLRFPAYDTDDEICFFFC